MIITYDLENFNLKDYNDQVRQNYAYELIPDELKAIPRWSFWQARLNDEKKKIDKPPVDKFGNNFNKTQFDLSFSEALHIYTKENHYGLSGLGYYMGDDGTISHDGYKLVIIDFDKGKDKLPQAEELLSRLDSYTELSQSGKGVHCLVWVKDFVSRGTNDVNNLMEIYDKKSYFILTGNFFRGEYEIRRFENIDFVFDLFKFKEVKEVKEVKKVPALLLPDEEVISKIRNCKGDGSISFVTLYDVGFIGNRSNDDMTFFNVLAWWTNGDQEQMKRIYRNSAIYREGKSDNYLNGTINKAIVTTRGGYSPVVSNNNNTDKKSKKKLNIKWMKDVTAREVVWIVPKLIPRGHASILQADCGVGKTYFCLKLCAAITTGNAFAGAEPQPSNVLLCSYEEEDYEVRRKLERLGADMNRFAFWNGEAQDGEETVTVRITDLESIQQAIEECNPALVIVDSITSGLGGEVDANKFNEVGSFVSSLERLASRMDIGILLLQHVNKGNGQGHAKGLGSKAFISSVRSVIGMVKTAPQHFAVKLIKSNLAPDNEPAKEYQINEFGDVVLIGDREDINAVNIYDQNRETDAGKPDGKQEICRKICIEYLTPENDFKCDAEFLRKLIEEEEGISRETFKIVRKNMLIKHVKDEETGKYVYFMSGWKGQ